MPAALGHWALDLGVQCWELPSFQVSVSCSTFAIQLDVCLPHFPLINTGPREPFSPLGPHWVRCIFSATLVIFSSSSLPLYSPGVIRKSQPIPLSRVLIPYTWVGDLTSPHFYFPCTVRLLHVWPSMVCWVGKKESHRALPSKSSQISWCLGELGSGR